MQPRSSVRTHFGCVTRAGCLITLGQVGGHNPPWGSTEPSGMRGGPTMCLWGQGPLKTRYRWCRGMKADRQRAFPETLLRGSRQGSQEESSSRRLHWQGNWRPNPFGTSRSTWERWLEGCLEDGKSLRLLVPDVKHLYSYYQPFSVYRWVYSLRCPKWVPLLCQHPKIHPTTHPKTHPKNTHGNTKTQIPTLHRYLYIT